VGVFEFVIVLVFISTTGKIVSRLVQRSERPARTPALPPGEVEGLRDALDELNSRVVRLEEEKDFYKELIESSGRRRALSDPAAEAARDE